MLCFQIPLFLLIVVSVGTQGSNLWYYALRMAKQFTDSSNNYVSFQPTVTQKVKDQFIVDAPDHIDYREQGLVTPVKTAVLGSTVYYAAIEAIEGLARKKNGVDVPPLSVKQAIKCTNISTETPFEVIKDMVNHCLVAEGDYDNDCNTPKGFVNITSGVRFLTRNVEDLKRALADNGAPMAIEIYMSPEMEHLVGKRVINPTDCNDHEPNQSVLLVGYNTDPLSGKTYWIIKNSCGPDWGDEGYFYLDVNSHCSILKNGATTAVISLCKRS